MKHFAKAVQGSQFQVHGWSKKLVLPAPNPEPSPRGAWAGPAVNLLTRNQHLFRTRLKRCEKRKNSSKSSINVHPKVDTKLTVNTLSTALLKTNYQLIMLRGILIRRRMWFLRKKLWKNMASHILRLTTTRLSGYWLSKPEGGTWGCTMRRTLRKNWQG